MFVALLVVAVGVVGPSAGVLFAAPQTDDFNRADSTNLGANWNEVSPATEFSISSNELLLGTNTGRQAMWTTSLASDDMFVEFTVRANSGDYHAVLAAGNTTLTTAGYYVIGKINADGKIYIQEAPSAVCCTVRAQTASSQGVVTGDVIRAEIDQGAITVYKNGVSVLSYDDSGSPQTGLYAGVFLGVNGARIDDFEADVMPPPAPTCQSIGISYETKPAGVGTSWSAVTLSDWPELTFGDSIRWTMSLPATAGAQVDELWFLNSNHTPLTYTGDPPNYQSRWLAPFAFDPDNADVMAAVESGIGIGTIRAIAPGDANAVQTGPATLSGTWTFLGDTGTEPSFNVWCHIYGGSTWERFDSAGSSYGAGVSTTTSDACVEARVIAWEAAGSDTHWGFKVYMPNALTQFQKLEWRTETQDETSTEPTLTAWATAYDPTDTSAAFSATFTIAKTSLTNPYSVEWRVTCTKAGGGTKTMTKGTIAPTGGGEGDYAYVGGDESCYGSALGSMDLTKPRTWVVGAGKLGVCLIEWLFVPNTTTLGNKFEEFTTELEAQLPFSLLYSLITFGANFYEGATDSAETGCMDMGGNWSFGAYGDVAVPDVCIGEDLTVSSGQRQTLVYLMLGGLWFAVARHAFGLVRGSALGGAFNA